MMIMKKSKKRKKRRKLKLCQKVSRFPDTSEKQKAKANLVTKSDERVWLRAH
jgi:hypothetical protein